MKKLVFDVGASAIKYAIMDNNAQIYEKGSESTPQDSLDSFLEVLKTIYQKFESEVDGIAMSLPGTIDSKKGRIYAPGGLLYNENVKLVDEIHKFTHLPVPLENDGKSAALAEAWKGHLKDGQDGIVIVVGSGLGGGIIKDGKLWKGSHLFAGEFSFISQGKSESFIENVWAMQGSTSALILNVAKRKSLDPSQLDGIKIFKMIENNDADALQALNDLAKSLATGIYNLQWIVNTF